MKNTIRISLLLLTIVVIVCVAGYLLPGQTHIERATYIKAPPETVYGLIDDFRQFNKWSPWAQRDPDTHYIYSGPQHGLGASMTWSSDNSEVGSGKQTIIDVRPFSKLRVALEFDGTQAIVAYYLEALEGGTHIQWTFDIDHGNNIFNRYAGLMMDHWVGNDYEQGLHNLRKLAEQIPPLPEQEIVTETIQYSINDASYTAYLAYDRNRGKRPGVLLVHDGWDHNDFVKNRAKALAELGYTAMAMDIYGDGKQAAHPDEAKAFSNVALTDFTAAQTRFTAALDVLKNHPATNADHLAAIGYGFGGTVVLNMARAGVDLNGVVSFYAELQPVVEITPAGGVHTKILVLNGADDSFVTPEHKQAFYQEMDAAGVDYEFIDYPNASHAFTNPAADDYAKTFELPLAYDEQADHESWQQMRTFFNRIFE